MSSLVLPDLDLQPPFTGFPKEGIAFLKRLKKNNNREWFAAHKDEYEELVRQPMLSLIEALQPHFQRFAPDFDLTPKRAIFRVYRDTRFSADKTPYKTHVAAHFVIRGKDKGFLGSGYYLHVEPGEMYVGGGIYMPDNDQLKKIRAHVAANGEEFLSIINARAFKKRFGKLEGNALTRIPKGYDESHPMAEWLKLKQFFAGVSWPETKSHNTRVVKEIADVCETLAPLVNFLNAAMSK
ncbi:MAG: DUF2461 domain-containing protein [Bacteroidetes bacterium]|jgi:uncharacterized protein (TIGR02453 family)|nr:DUF2461 domain-containing protein [Bacteroidota bacterium]